MGTLDESDCKETGRSTHIGTSGPAIELNTSRVDWTLSGDAPIVQIITIHLRELNWLVKFTNDREVWRRPGSRPKKRPRDHVPRASPEDPTANTDFASPNDNGVHRSDGQDAVVAHKKTS